jgi:ABC-type phosphate transport system substrate-binding protein
MMLNPHAPLRTPLSQKGFRMKKTRIVAQLSVAVAVTAAVAAGTATGAGADPAPTTTDVVGVGSDIVQNSMDFIADGDTHGNPGYNSTGNKNRVVNFDATADGNGRNAFTDPSLGTSVVLNPTVVLRAGTSPVQRPNGGSAGITALINDGTGATARISYVRSPNAPTAAQQTTAKANLGTPLHTIQFADDKQVIATASTTNAPAALSAAQLLKIYTGGPTTWSAITGGADPSTATIIPEIPQPGAGVRTIFTNALVAANGGNAVTLGTNVLPVQQNDPTTITSSTDPANSIVPFPVGRYTLLQNGYFLNPNTPYSAAGATPVSASGIKLEQPATGLTASDGAAAFSADLPYYIIFRESDFASSTPWQPGSTLNWVQELFYNPGGTPYVESAPAQAILKAMGVTPLYQDLGNGQ